MRDLRLKLISASDIAAMAAALWWLIVFGAWIAGLVLLVAGLLGGVLVSAWIIGVRNTPRSGIYK